MRREKRLDRLIECFAALPDQTAQLLIVGGGPERDALEAQAKSLGGRVRFAGEQSDVAPFLNDMDIYALSSDTEQMPISLVEGMASGLPVAATNVGDVASMVCDANRAHVVPLGDDAALTNAMAKLCSDASLRAELGAANSARAKQHYGLRQTSSAPMERKFQSLLKTNTFIGRAINSRTAHRLICREIFGGDQERNTRR